MISGSKKAKPETEGDEKVIVCKGNACIGAVLKC
jgi:hypothetical protein